MITAPIPPNEHQRLQALYALRLLDTPEDQRFDSITGLAAAVLRVPMAFVSLVGPDRQWLRSRVGLSVCETARDVSLCAHAILSDEAMIVTDTHCDPRFVDNPVVTGEPNIRFYAGQPLRAPGGERIGTLCVADHCPRTLIPEEVALLKRLGALIEREMRMGELLEAQGRLLETQEQLLETQARLSAELKAAGEHIESLIPPPMVGPVSIDWRLIPSENLGGDCLGYSVADEKLMLFILDVCGHGVEAAMLSVTLLHLLQSRSLQGVDFHDPAAVLTSLNRHFQMERNGGKFFTIWYGVLDLPSGRLSYSCGGHPPPVLIRGGKIATKLGTHGIAVGCIRSAVYERAETSLASGDLLYLFSDGAFETGVGRHEHLSYPRFEDLLVRRASTGGMLDGIIEELRSHAGGRVSFPDDVSLVRVQIA